MGVQITINGVTGSVNNLSLGQPVQLSAVLSGLPAGPTFLWTLADIPTGSSAALNSATIQNPTFTPDVEGTYMVSLLVNQLLPAASQASDLQEAGVPFVDSGMRAPGAGESTQSNLVKGWSQALNAALSFLDNAQADPETLVCVNASNSAVLANGTPVYLPTTGYAKAGFPGQTMRPGCLPLTGSTAPVPAAIVGIVEGAANPKYSTVEPGELARVRVGGLFSAPLTVSGTPNAGTPIWVAGSPTGAASQTVGTVAWPLGYVVPGNGNAQTNLGPWTITAGDSFSINGSPVSLTVGSMAASALTTAVNNVVSGLASTITVGGNSYVLFSSATLFTFSGNAATLAKFGLAAASYGGEYWLLVNGRRTPPRTNLIFGALALPNSPGTSYLGPGFGSYLSASAPLALPTGGAVSAFTLSATAAAMGGTTTFNIRNNGTVKASLNVAAGGSGEFSEVITNQAFTCISGDLIDVQIISGSGLSQGIANPVVTLELIVAGGHPMLIELTGIVEDGSEPGALFLPQNPRLPVQVTQNTSLTLLVKCWDRSGTPIPAAAEGTALTLTIAGNPAWSPWVKEAATAAAKYGENASTVLLGAVQWRQIPYAGTFVYGFWLAQAGGANDPVIPAAPFQVLSPG